MNYYTMFVVSRPCTCSQATRRIPRVGSESLHKVGSLCRQLVRVRPKICDPRNPVVVVQLEETEARLASTVRVREVDPASSATMLTNNPNDFKVPISWETFDVEPHVSGAPSDSFAGLRSLIDHVFGDKVSEGIPVSVIRCRPVRGYNIARLAHTLESSVGQTRTGDP
jgi:hypothetical protein